MKWTNKGHQFDYIGQNFDKNMKVYIYGAGENGIELLHHLGFTNCVEGFIDNNVNKVGKYIEGEKIYSLYEFINLDKPKHIVVVAQALENMAYSLEQLVLFGYTEGKNVFTFHSFLTFYLTLFAYYAYGKLYVPTASMLMTTLCNLDCKGCLNFNHYNTKRQHYSIERLKEDIDYLFDKVDLIGAFHLCGGEPFLYPHFAELINYVSTNYATKICHFGSTTNGTVVPSKELCSILHKAKVEVVLDDYRQNVELARQKMHLVSDVLRTNDVIYTENLVDSWLNIEQGYQDEKEEETIIKCTGCHIPFVSVKNRKLYGCNYCDYAIEASKSVEESSDYINLEENMDRVVLMEYILGYTETGYYSYCKTCKGFLTINQDKIAVAEQYSQDV